jgi:hypothetical protein
MDFSKYNLSNISKGPLSTVVGLLLGAVAIAGVFLTDKVSWEAAMAVVFFLTVPLALSSDKRAKKPKPPTLIVLLCVGLAMSACIRPPQYHTEISDSTWTLETPRPVPIKIPQSKAELKLKLQLNAQTGQVEPVAKSATNERATVAVSVSADGYLTASSTCDSLEAIVMAKDRELNRLRSEKKTVIVREAYTAWYDMTCRWLVIVIALYFGGRFAIKRMI